MEPITSKSIAPHPVAPPPVIGQIDRIEGLIHDLAGELSRLDEQLYSVLRPQSDGAESGECCASVASSPLTERLDGLGDKLQFRINTVRALLARLEV